MANRFYITTPIYYVSDKPHLGHAYTTIVADALARYHRMRGQPTRFLTGTDDHGQKIARLAEAAATSPKDYADKYAESYRATWRALNISNDDFIRTTDPDHEAVVQELWRTMEKNGHIYLGDYEGWYCVACEQFYTEKELNPGNECPVHKRPVDRIKEQSYYFRLSAFADRLLEHYAKHPEFILPDNRRNEVEAFVRSGLQDLSVSRTTFDWGVPVPNQVEGKHKHVVYVWLDALTNYYSATRRSAEASAFWNDPDSQIVHMVGKEISRFHAVYWPAFLMAAEWPLPKTIFAHGWWTVEGEKMSKTRGNVVDPLVVSADIGVDAFRYFVLREIPLGNDGDYSREGLLQRYNAELANDLGNLLNRTLGMAHKYFGGHVPVPDEPYRGNLTELFVKTLDQTEKELEAFSPSRALTAIWELVRAGNAYVDQAAPWSAPESRRAEILSTALALVHGIANLIAPFMPERAAEMLRQLGRPGETPVWPTQLPTGLGWSVTQPVPIFPRLDDDRKAALLAKWAPTGEPEAPKPKVAATAAAPPASTAPPPASTVPLIKFADFEKVELRTAVVRVAEPVPKAKKLLRLEVDLGDHQRQIVSGIAEAYAPSDLVGKTVVVVTNLEPATIRGVRSEGMLLAVGKDSILGLCTVDKSVGAGEPVK